MKAADGPSQRVLLVEDDPENLLLFQTWLGQAGYLVMPAAKGQNAVEWLQQPGKPDLAVIDRTLPDMDGLDICRAVKRDPETRKIPVLMLTARADNASRIEAGDGAADLYLNKPITEKDFLDGVRALLAQSGGRLERRGLLHRDGFEIDPERRSVFFNGTTSADLGGKLFDLLYLLAEHHPQVLSRKFILARLGMKTRDREVDSLVSLLRAELKRLFHSEMVETVSGQGYRLQLPAPFSKAS